jgi:hypothetical protein
MKIKTDDKPRIIYFTAASLKALEKDVNEWLGRESLDLLPRTVLCSQLVFIPVDPYTGKHMFVQAITYVIHNNSSVQMTEEKEKVEE